jgi:hypothetical protein
MLFILILEVPLALFASNAHFFYMRLVPAAIWWFCRLCEYVTSHSLKFFLLFLKAQFLGSCYLTYLLMICAVLLRVEIFWFADDIKTFRTVSCATDCTLLLFDIDSIRSWCAANGMKLNNDQTGLITVMGKTNVLNYN